MATLQPNPQIHRYTIMIRSIFFAFILLLSASCKAQMYYSTDDKKAIKLFEAAQECLRVSPTKIYPDYKCAIGKLTAATERDDKFEEAWLQLGEIYEKTGQNKKAIDANVRVLDMSKGSSANSSLYYFTAKLEMKEGMYENAKKHASYYLGIRNNNTELANRCSLMVQSCEFAIEALKNPVEFEPINCGPGVNTAAPEYFPAITADENQLLFTRLIPDSRVPQQLGGKQEDFYISEAGDGNWKTAKSIGGSINSVFNEGAPTFSADGKVLIFTACELMDQGYGENRRGAGSCDLFYAVKQGGIWSAPGNISSPINTWDWESQPSYSADGKTLYFVRGKRRKQARRDPKEQDIYVSHYDSKNGWSTPEKLGPNINTPGREESVFIHPDGQTLYFSSDGHPGMGGLDIYMSRKQADGSWGPAINLGYPINTADDENSLLISRSGEKAFFASDREGGYGSLDLYWFKLPEHLRPIKTTYVSGLVYDAISKDKLGAKFTLTDKETGEIVVSSYSDATNGDFLLALPANKNYALHVEKDGYMFFSKEFQLKESENEEPYYIDIPLIPIGGTNGSVVLENVYFDLDKATLKPVSKVELNKLKEFLDQHPQIKIELHGHTDNQGDDDHNMRLSQARAEAVMNYLIENGIEAKRLSAKGFGETDPITTNDTPEGRAKNRRTVYKIVG